MPAKFVGRRNERKAWGHADDDEGADPGGGRERGDRERHAADRRAEGHGAAEAGGGMRTSLFVFEMADSSQIPPDIEPLFQMLEASVDLRPVMNAEELQAGLGQLG
jgi:hypothetical protein